MTEVDNQFKTRIRELFKSMGGKIVFKQNDGIELESRSKRLVASPDKAKSNAKTLFVKVWEPMGRTVLRNFCELFYEQKAFELGKTLSLFFVHDVKIETLDNPKETLEKMESDIYNMVKSNQLKTELVITLGKMQKEMPTITFERADFLSEFDPELAFYFEGYDGRYRVQFENGKFEIKEKYLDFESETCSPKEIETYVRNHLEAIRMANRIPNLISPPRRHFDDLFKSASKKRRDYIHRKLLTFYSPEEIEEKSATERPEIIITDLNVSYFSFAGFGFVENTSTEFTFGEKQSLDQAQFKKTFIEQVLANKEKSINNFWSNL